MELKYFKLEEFDSPDVPGSGSYMDPELLLMLDEARRISGGVPFRINSGWRSIERNRAAGEKREALIALEKRLMWQRVIQERDSLLLDRLLRLECLDSESATRLYMLIMMRQKLKMSCGLTNTVGNTLDIWASR